jgi:Bacterial nucleoid DNA-binding protein
MHINKQKIVQGIYNSGKVLPKLSKVTVALVVDLFLEEIKSQFKKGNIIEIRGFGTLYPHFKKGRKYCVPGLEKAQETVGRTTLKFRPSHQILVYERSSK